MGQAATEPRSWSVRLGQFTFECDTYAAAASPRGTVILLHGFPQDKTMWLPVAAVLAAEGYTVHAIDQRGYSPGAQPSSIRAYTLRDLAADVQRFINDVVEGPVHLVGHDWGGSVVWQFAATWPERVTSVAVLSMPHPTALRRSGGVSQACHSVYILPLLLPRAMKFLLQLREGRLARQWLRKMGMTAAVADRSIALLRRPGVLQSSLKWYQALPIDISRFRDVEQIAAPALYIWGSNDAAISRGAAEATPKYLTNGEFLETQNSHWIVDESPDVVVKALLSHFERFCGNES